MRNFNNFEGNKQNNGDAFNVLKGFAKQYEGASEQDIISAILKEAEKGKRNGTLKDSDIDNFANMLYPMLNAAQRKQLEKVVKTIKQK
ncbi:MAG: hypothetical protein IKV61_00220 [Clostridia bacterium]|nr:hypothetical protein [Clostridia bacterium]